MALTQPADANGAANTAAPRARRASLLVPGAPQPAGSKTPRRNTRTGGLYVSDANPKAAAWKLKVALAAQHAMHTRGLEATTAPVRVEVLFAMPRPKTHYRTGRNSGWLRRAAPTFHTQPPDVDKLSRAVLDALTSVVWADDAQVTRKVASKRWAHPDDAGVAIYAEWHEPTR